MTANISLLLKLSTASCFCFVRAFIWFPATFVRLLLTLKHLVTEEFFFLLPLVTDGQFEWTSPFLTQRYWALQDDEWGCLKTSFRSVSPSLRFPPCVRRRNAELTVSYTPTISKWRNSFNRSSAPDLCKHQPMHTFWSLSVCVLYRRGSSGRHLTQNWARALQLCSSRWCLQAAMNWGHPAPGHWAERSGNNSFVPDNPLREWSHFLYHCILFVFKSILHPNGHGLCHNKCCKNGDSRGIIFCRNSQKCFVFVFLILQWFRQVLKLSDLFQSEFPVVGVCPCLVELMLFSNKGACKVQELVACSSAQWRMCQLNSGETHSWLQASYKPDQISQLPQMLNAHERGNPHGRCYTWSTFLGFINHR